MKRLLCIVSKMDAGGAETFLMKLYRELDKSLYQLDFCVQTEENGLYDDEIKKYGGHIYTIVPKTVDLKTFKKELNLIIKNHHYHYVLRITANAFGLLDLKIAKKAGAKICIARSSNSSSGSGFKNKIAHLYGRLFFKKYVDVRIAPSLLAAQYTFGKKVCKNNRVVFLNNGLNLQIYKYSEENRSKIIKEFNVQNKFIVGHIGRFNEQKNHSYLLDVFYEIKKQKQNAVLFLVGKGELENEIKTYAKNLGIIDDIIFTGIREDIPSLLSAFDVFVFPSFYEGMPNVVIEAQAVGVPCLVSDTITNDVKISNVVFFEKLTSKAAVWANKAIEISKNREYFPIIDEKYDIRYVTKQFVNVVFSED